MPQGRCGTIGGGCRTLLQQRSRRGLSWERQEQNRMHSLPRPNANAPPAKQFSLQLAIHDVPDLPRQHGLAETHRNPRVSHGNVRQWSRRVPTARAWSHYEELELHSARARTALVVLGPADPKRLWEIVLGNPLVCIPNWVAKDHAVYTFAQPVIIGPGVRPQPLALLAIVAENYARAYGANPNYELTHNPTHPCYAETTSWLREEAYTLGELAAPIPKRDRRIPEQPLTLEGRNCCLFMAAMKHFGKRGNLDAGCDADFVHEWLQTVFDDWYDNHREDWHPRENWWIAKHVASYCRENRLQPRRAPHFIGRQAWKGRRSGEARRLESIEAAAPWLDLGISRSTWYRHRGLPAPKLSDLRPWELEGISKRTWYRRRNHQRQK